MGGGYLRNKENLEFERLNKTKRKKLVIASILGLGIIIGGIGLYRSYALYEEEKEYNVLKGQIPDFGYDVKLGYTINGESGQSENFPVKDGEYWGEKVTCNENVTGEWDNLNWGLKNLKNIGEKNPASIKCTVEFRKRQGFSEQVKLGDYIKMTPSLNTFTISGNLTGCAEESQKCGLDTETLDQTINPSNLDLWRVISKNEDGTIDVISEYVSEEDIAFYGKVGYKNLVGVLNLLASAYGNSEYVKSTRHVGYAGQTPFLSGELETEGLANTQKPEWQPSMEVKGGGDKSFGNDATLVRKIFGNLNANKKSTQAPKAYAFASRRFYITATRDYYDLSPQCVNIATGDFGNCALSLRGTTNRDTQKDYAIRPVLTLKSGLTASDGDGSSEESPWVLN